MRKKVSVVTGLAFTLAALLAVTMLFAGPGSDVKSAGAAGEALALDMDITNGTGPCSPIDASAAVGVGSFQVAVCLTNPGILPVAAFKYDIDYNDSQIVAPEVADVSAATSLDDNPDANVGSTTFSTPNLGGGWSCEGGVGAYPKGDVDGIANGVGKAFSGGCGSAAGPNTLLQGPLGVITFNAPAIGGPFTLSISNASVTADDLSEIGSCNPTVDVAMTCTGGSVTVSAPPTNTPTNTATATNTATNTATATATPAGPTVNKVPNIANLFLCEVGPCAGPGEGDVILDEIATNISEPLGGFEIQVKFDHKIFNVLWTPNLSPALWPGRVPNCSLQIVTENWILFGCVSTGPVGSGFTGGPISLGTITLTPNADMRFRLHPGNDNGVVRMILDENCEIANTLGHPQPGSINGGLTLECGDAAITVRILEGDLNLDCTVDIIDEQAIAQRYGTFFGNIFYDPWYDLEPALKDFDVDIKDVQKVFGRDGSTCQNPIQPQPPVAGLSVGPL